VTFYLKDLLNVAQHIFII